MGSGPSGIKTASEAEERAIVDRAKRLADDPTLLLPECVHDDADSCHLRKIEDDLLDVLDRYGDESKLERKSGGWFTHDLVQGLAGTLIVAMEGEAPYLGQVGLAGRKVPYAKRGKADKADLAAVQHFDDPRLRVLPLADDIAKKDLHVYSCRAGWWCSGTEADPPDAYVDEVLSQVDVVQRQAQGVHACSHVPPDRLGEDGPAHLVLTWETAGIDIAICEGCASDDNAAVTLMAGIASPDPAGEFAIDVHLPTPECRGHEGTCPAAQAYREDVAIDGYLDGQYPDRNVFGEAREQIQERLRRGDPYFLARDVCFGDDVDAFLDRLEASQLERTALRPVLRERSDPLIAEGSTANELLSQLWEMHGDRFLASVSDDDTAESVRSEMDPRDTPPAQILRAASGRHQRANLAEQLPSYGDLPRPVAVANRIARTHRLEGRKEAIRACDPDRDWGTNAKAVGYGFLLAMDAASGEEWKFSEDERESGAFLEPRAEELLDADADAYHDALVEVARAAGVTTSFTPQG